MALELGGPDIPENIVPQWAKFQGTGTWRKMETAVLKTAKSLTGGQSLEYHVDVSYKETGTVTPTIRSFGVPSHFRAATQIFDAKGKPQDSESVVFDEAQAQDVTDNMLAERQMRAADGSDWDPSLDSGKQKPKRPREPAKKKKPPPKIASTKGKKRSRDRSSDEPPKKKRKRGTQ